jgi:deoxycytidylate deaminase
MMPMGIPLLGPDPSSIISEHAADVGESIETQELTIDLIDKYQSVGNNLRSKFGESYLVDRSIEKIAIERDQRGGYAEINSRRVLKPDKRVYFLDSLKNPAELKRLRQVYGDLLWVVTVFATDEVRLKRLIDRGVDENVARHAMKRDYEEEEKSGQKVSKIAHQANYFIRNNTDLKDDINDSIDRFLESIMGLKLHTPNAYERGMMEASSVAVRSACLSRQVGAAVYDKDGQLLGVGCNDVPKFKGGLYGEGPEDHRCFHWKGKECHNDRKKLELAKRLVAAIGSGAGDQLEKVSEILELGVGNLIEFSRSVHAEMEAIVSVARMGAGSLLGGTLYTTTYPCHNCARHIVAAGITKVVYVEPYSKSLALELHSDSITLDEKCEDKVKFVQYQGFAPRTSIRLFSSADKERKSGGKYVETTVENAIPIFASPLDSYTTSENLIIQNLDPGAEAKFNGAEGQYPR